MIQKCLRNYAGADISKIVNEGFYEAMYGKDFQPIFTRGF